MVDLQGVKIDMNVDLTCDECGSIKINPEGYCTDCGLYVPKTNVEGSYWQWSTCDFKDIKPDPFHGNKRGIPWVDCTAIALDRMMEYPEAIKFLEDCRISSFHQLNMGECYIPSYGWRADTWRNACQRLMNFKCRVSNCYKMAHKRSSGRTTKTKLCKEHMDKYLHLSAITSVRNSRARGCQDD